MSFTTRTKITALFASIVSILIILLNLLIFESSNTEWQSKKTEYMKESMQTMLTIDEAKKMFVDLQVEDGSGNTIYKQWIFTHNMTHESIGSWIFNDPYITIADGRYYYWWIKSNNGGYTYKTVDDVTYIISTRDMMIERSLLLSAIGFFLIILIGYIFSGYILRPIQNMNEATRRFSLSEKWETRHVGIYGNIKDEVVILARSLEELFARVNKEAERLEQFSDDIAHEIKNRLFEIMSSLDIAMTSRDPNLGIMKAKSILKQLSSVVDALLFFARNEVKDPVKTDIAKFLSTSLGREDTRLCFIEERKMMIPIYPELFLTAVGNIVWNAEKFTPKDGKITLTIDEKWLTIADTGKGIPKKDLPYIFDRLYKVDKARTTDSGQGLGLSISKKIIEDLHGMKLSVKSIEGEGTSFLVEWKS